MSVTRGREGTVKVGSAAVGEIRDWTLTESTEIADVSTLNSQDEKTIGTLNRRTVKFECFYDPTDATQNMFVPGAQMTVILVSATGKQRSGGITVEEVEIAQGGVTGVVGKSITARGNGAWT